MRRDRLGAVYLTRPSSVHYYSGFSGDDSTLLVTQRKAFLITDFRYVEEAEHSTHDCEVVTWKGSLHGHAGSLLKKSRVTRAGFEASHLSVSAHRALKEPVRGVRLIPWDAPAAQPRRTKSTWEIRQIRKSLRIAEAGFLAARAQIRPGMLETDLQRELEYQMQLQGADGAAFPTIVARTANASLPHAHPGRRKIQAGGLVLIDWGARLGHYNSDLTRTLFVDSIPAIWRQRYEAVLEAQLLALQNLASTRSGAEIDQIARKSLAQHKLDKRFGHSLGHGVGLEVHEGPGLGGRSKAPLETGAVVTVEPGVYFPRSGGIRIEDMALVGPSGCTVLSRLPKDLEWAVV
jgi:Xaa-Pro aminopeptidase